MIRKILFAVLSFSILISSVQAAALDGLKKAYDDLTYALEVEWDQKDQNFKREQLEKFNASIAELQKQGLTNSELMDFTLAQVKDESIKKDIQTTLSLVSINQMSQLEARNLIKQTLDKSRSQGASWSGKGEDILLGIVIIALIALALSSDGGSSTPRPTGAQPDGSYCGYSDYCSWQYDDFFGGDRYTCDSIYACVR
ncbi:MAG: hypothetical protein AB7I27_07530 [Bacteriovoracaceae bacterium]